MGRGHWHPSRCKVCGRHANDVGGISQKGFCYQHGYERMVENEAQMRAGKGPFARYWAWRIADAAWGLPLDEAPPRP